MDPHKHYSSSQYSRLIGSQYNYQWLLVYFETKLLIEILKECKECEFFVCSIYCWENSICKVSSRLLTSFLSDYTEWVLNLSSTNVSWKCLVFVFKNTNAMNQVGKVDLFWLFQMTMMVFIIKKPLTHNDQKNTINRNSHALKYINCRFKTFSYM